MMNPRKNLYALCAVLILSIFAVSCATRQANKLIKDGNAAVEEGKKLYEQANTKETEMAQSLDGFPENRDQLKGKAQEITDLLDKAIAKLREGAAKFDEGSKTDIDAKLKEYLSLKSQEFSKHAEHLEVEKEIPKAVMDTSITDMDSLRAKFTSAQERLEKLQQEWIDLASKAEKIKQENKDKFES
jgi:uncharacterized phage infection (PIP) family protein YhgE